MLPIVSVGFLALALCASVEGQAMQAGTDPAPSSRARAFDISRYGAVGDGKTLDTAAIQRAVDTCHAAGGGTVYVPPGTWLTGSVRLRSRVTLYLDSGATLLGSRRIENYDPKHLLHATDAEDVTIAGGGRIDGQGDAFWEPIPPTPPGTRPRWPKPLPRPSPLLEFVNCQGVQVRDISIHNAPGWTVHPFHCDGVVIRGVTIRNNFAGPNTDGIDVDACRNVMISECDIYTGDDAVVLKNTGRGGRKRLSRNITVTNCLLSTICNGFKMGTETLEGFEDVCFSNSVIYNDARGPQAISGVAIEMVDGAHLARVSVSNITMKNVRAPIFVRLGNRGRGQEVPTPGTLRDVSLSHITATGAEITSSITGLPGHNVENVRLSNIRITHRGGGTPEDAARRVPERPGSYPEATMYGTLPAAGLYARHVQGLHLDHVQIAADEPDARPVLVCDDVQDLDVDGLGAAAAPAEQPLIRLIGVRDAFIRGCRAPRGTTTFLQVEGAESGGVAVIGNELSSAARAVVTAAGAGEVVVR